MANLGTRIHKVGSIYSRVRDMLKAGVMSENQKPLWYAIYEAFPPKREPVHIPEPVPDENGLITVVDHVKPILYKEDWARACYKKFHGSTAVYDFGMDRENETERFVQDFLSLQKKYPKLSKEDVFNKTEEKLVLISRRYL